MNRMKPNIEPMDSALRAIMAERCMSEIELAYIAGVSASTVNLYVNGHRGRRMNTQSLRVVRRLARALKVRPDYFVEYRLWKNQRILEWAARQGIVIEPEEIRVMVELRRNVAKIETMTPPARPS